MTCLLIADLREGSFYLDCSSLNVKNIYDASLLCNNILMLKGMNVLGFSTAVRSSLVNVRRIIAPAEQNSRRQSQSMRESNTSPDGVRLAEGEDNK